jgi:hypothetical protein
MIQIKPKKQYIVCEEFMKSEIRPEAVEVY